MNYITLVLNFLCFPRIYSWEDFYIEEDKTNLALTYIAFTAKENIVLKSGSVYVKNSFFESLEQADFGGGLNFNATGSNENARILIEDSAFINCSAINSGGGIYIKNAETVISKVCGYDCTTYTVGDDNDGTFCNTYTKLDNPQKYLDYVFDAQVSHCTNTRYGYTISLHYGNVVSKGLNVSQCDCNKFSIIRSAASVDCQGAVCYSSFSNNTALNDKLMGSNTEADFEYNTTNIIYNKVNTGGNLIYLVGNTVFRQMCILQNKCDGDTFFQKTRLTVIMINCTIDDVSCTFPITTDDILPPNSFINALKLLNTRLCEGEYDVVGTLKPVIKESVCHKTCIHQRKRSYATAIVLPVVYTSG